MIRNQRRLSRAPKRNENEGRSKVKDVTELEEVFPPKNKRELDKPATTNRCCFVSPDQKDFGQLTEIEPTDKYQNRLVEQYSFDPLTQDTICQLKELRKVLCVSVPKVENSSQYAKVDSLTQIPAYIGTVDGQWQNVDNTDEIDKYIPQNKDEETFTNFSYQKLPEDVHISEVPRVKIIAEKFSRFKKNNIELRKLDEKVVCVEYDIFDKASPDETAKPVQRMRAFFSIKPVYADDSGGKGKAALSELSSTIKNRFKIADDDLKRLNEKEVEIIDGKISENKPYLDDLKRILRRNQTVIAKKNKSSLDLKSLYEMAKRERGPINSSFSNTNLLSKAELQEVKDLILTKCTSSVQGISRRTVKREKETAESKKDGGIGIISESIVAELLREDGKTNVFD